MSGGGWSVGGANAVAGDQSSVGSLGDLAADHREPAAVSPVVLILFYWRPRYYQLSQSRRAESIGWLVAIIMMTDTKTTAAATEPLCARAAIQKPLLLASVDWVC